MRPNELKGSDSLEKMMNRERLEKAPDGFTSKVMASVVLEKAPVRKGIWNLSDKSIPLVVVSILAIMVIISAVLPSGNQSAAALEISKILRSLTFTDGQGIKFTGFSVPAVLVYAAVSIPTLIFFDLLIKKVTRKRS
jgi:hypothetical protein